jgi:SRSO17 transposase
MSLLTTPEAVSLLADAKLTAATVTGLKDRLSHFLQRYLPWFYRKEQRQNALLVIRGLLSGLERKTCEPIAREAGVARKPVQFFVGSGKWDDEAVMAELRRHVMEELSDPQAVLVVDSSGFPKKGADSCGVARQWCGHLGKVENCQVGVFLCYSAPKGNAPVDRRLFLPKEWARDRQRRAQGHIPSEVRYRTTWQIALRMIQTHRRQLPHAYVVGDDEFGRVSRFRQKLRACKEHYVLDIPGRTLIRELRIGEWDERSPHGRMFKKKLPFVHVANWAGQQPASSWRRVEVRDAEKGPLVVEAISAMVQAKNGKRVGDRERLLVIRTVEKPPRLTYCLSNASPNVPLKNLVQARKHRFWVEHMFEQAKGDAGLDQYEVRSWVGWHHHVTLSLVATWFLALECRWTAEKKDTRDHRLPDPRNIPATAEKSAAVTSANCADDYECARA